MLRLPMFTDGPEAHHFPPTRGSRSNLRPAVTISFSPPLHGLLRIGERLEYALARSHNENFTCDCVFVWADLRIGSNAESRHIQYFLFIVRQRFSVSAVVENSATTKDTKFTQRKKCSL